MTNYDLDAGVDGSNIIILFDFPNPDVKRSGNMLGGRSGYALHQLLNQANISVSDCLVTYCHEEFDNKKLMNTKGAFTTHGAEIRDQVANRLNQLSGNIIVPVGPFACAVTTGDHRLKFNRGSLTFNEEIQKKVLPTFTPTSVAFVPADRLMCIWDLRKAKANSHRTDYKPPERTLHINPTVYEVEQFLEYCKMSDNPTIAVDIETLNGAVFCIGFAPSPNVAMCVNFDNRTVEEEIQLWKLCTKLLQDPSVTKIGQNFIFDMWFLAFRHNCFVKGPIEDTMVAHHIVYPDLPKGLGVLTTLHTDEPYYKEEGGYWKGGIGDRTSFLNYNCKDCITTYKVWEKIKLWVANDSPFRDIYRTTLDTYPALIYMMARGIAINHEELANVRQTIDNEIHDIDASLQGVVQEESEDPLLTLNFNSPKQCMNYFYNVLKVKPYLKGGKPTLDDDALTRLAKGTQARPGLYSAQLIQQLRQRAKYSGTYLQIKFDSDKRFRCSYNPRGTKTGRLSSSKTVFGTGMNHQNLPLEFRSFMVPDQGKIFIEMDKRQSEWVITAYLCGDKNMIDILANNQDPHVSTARLITGLPDHVIKAEDKAIAKTTNPEEIKRTRELLLIDGTPFLDFVKTHQAFVPRTMSCRQVGKKSNHALNYMMGANRFSMESGLTLEEADRARSLYLSAYSRLPEWWEEVREQLLKNRTVTNIIGQPRKFLGIVDDKLLKDAVAHLPQSISVWIVNQAMTKIYNLDHRAEILSQVHDSLLFQYPYDDPAGLEIFCYQAMDAMEPKLKAVGDGIERNFYVYTDIKIGFDAAKMHDSTFTTVMDDVEKLSKLRKDDEVYRVAEVAV